MEAAHYKKDDLLHCWTSSSDISGGHSRTRHFRSRAGARHDMCELTHGVAGKRHGHGMLCVNRPLLYLALRLRTNGVILQSPSYCCMGCIDNVILLTLWRRIFFLF